ncbi:hypothetical protein MLD38_013604 [Melastoma candidum]|uniref:Uncharacterized protein n=1 Tax=Melastoma candidum TaxID=119954 RepID=A0ACB9R9Q4_9MYRT|nr:hypothetical protein MLD38_013604 [Melastoma candidum]
MTLLPEHDQSELLVPDPPASNVVKCRVFFDMNLQPPWQELTASDLHGNEWRFLHIFRGQPRRHLLTTGWSVFVSARKLVAGDAFIFLRTSSSEYVISVNRGPVRRLSGTIVGIEGLSSAWTDSEWSANEDKTLSIVKGIHVRDDRSTVSVHIESDHNSDPFNVDRPNAPSMSNNQHTITSFTLVLEFQEGTLQNSYWKKFGVTRDLLSALAAKTAVPNSRCSNNGGSCDLSIQVTSSGTDRNYEALNSWYEVGQLRRF